ncbi:MAG: CBS domain-containing protein [Desulfobacterales bacterium]
MQVKELLDKKGQDVCSVSPDATGYDALKLMAEKEIGALAVLEDGKMVGIVRKRGKIDCHQQVIFSIFLAIFNSPKNEDAFFVCGTEPYCANINRFQKMQLK